MATFLRDGVGDHSDTCSHTVLSNRFVIGRRSFVRTTGSPGRSHRGGGRATLIIEIIRSPRQRPCPRSSRPIKPVKGIRCHPYVRRHMGSCYVLLSDAKPSRRARTKVHSSPWRPFGSYLYLRSVNNLGFSNPKLFLTSRRSRIAVEEINDATKTNINVITRISMHIARLSVFVLKPLDAYMIFQ